MAVLLPQVLFCPVGGAGYHGAAAHGTRRGAWSSLPTCLAADRGLPTTDTMQLKW